MEKVGWIDSHCHLQLDPLDKDPHVVEEAIFGGVSHIVCIGVNLGEHEKLRKFKEKYPNSVFLALGEHPLNDDLDQVDWSNLSAIIAEDKDIIAVGETGFDSQANFQVQHRAFDFQAKIALENGLPVVLHTRNADQEAIAGLRRYPDLRGVLHCYTGGLELAKMAVSMGWKVSFSGILTYKSAENVREIAKKLPLDSLLIETDAPYLAPQVVRGKMNRPVYVGYVGEFLAQLRGLEVAKMAEILRENFFDLFKERF